MSNRIVVTGGSGFVGTPTVKALREKGYDVFNYDLKEGCDVRDYSQLVSKINFGDKILHLAAIARFAEADEDPKTAFETNVEGTRNVAKVARQLGCERLVYSSTGSVYMPIKTEPPMKESDKTIGNSVYGCSKNIGEIYVKESGVPYVILRYAHLYGEGKLKHGAIGGFIDRMERGLAPVLYGGKQSNDFTYIKDVVDANIKALETPNVNDIYNIGTGEELTVEDVFKIMSEFFDYHPDYERVEMRTVDPERFLFDISKAKSKLGFTARYDFQKGMADWFKKEAK